ncbi:MAG TPA: ABC transporter substrate-binding protein [Hyphomicrobiaceae bacterium]|jgi:NitT/TauT family transport system substrate-binding protein|nr:ABC transporter substrate-binding protein [Hyphomicrobiaceae bacterium]
MKPASHWIGALVALLPLALPAVATAQDTLKLAIGQRGNWETAMAEIGSRAGIFKKHNLNIERTYTSGGGETMQAVISGAVDVGVAVGTSGAMSAFAKGAPIRIVGSATVGSNDLYWYVKADSPLKSIKEATDKTTIAYSTAGSSTNVLVLGFLKTYNLKAQPAKIGNPPTTLTAVMSGQVDVGWAAPPFGLKEIEEGKIRIIARGSEVPSSRNQMVRTICVHADKLTKDKALIERFMTAYSEALDYMYNDPEALKIYKEFSGIDETLAKKAMAEFYPRAALDPYRIEGLDSVMADGVEHGFLKEPLNKDQLAQLIQVPARKN